MPFYSEHCVLRLDRREERRGSELQSLAQGEGRTLEFRSRGGKDFMHLRSYRIQSIHGKRRFSVLVIAFLAFS